MVVANEYERAVIEIASGKGIVDIHNVRASKCFPALYRPDRLLVSQTEA